MRNVYKNTRVGIQIFADTGERHYVGEANSLPD